MTKRMTYTCNLCGEDIDDASKCVGLVGEWFKSTQERVAVKTEPQHGWLHLCTGCDQALAKHYEDQVGIKWTTPVYQQRDAQVLAAVKKLVGKDRTIAGVNVPGLCHRLSTAGTDFEAISHAIAVLKAVARFLNDLPAESEGKA